MSQLRLSDASVCETNRGTVLTCRKHRKCGFHQKLQLWRTFRNVGTRTCLTLKLVFYFNRPAMRQTHTKK